MQRLGIPISAAMQALGKAIDRDLKMLSQSQVLPEDQVANREILNRLMHFYRDSAIWLATEDYF